MKKRRSANSVTDVECSCKLLQDLTDNPDWPIVFDPLVSEYHFKYCDSEGRSSYLIIFHCPFCGGATPPSKRHTLFYRVPRQEQNRLNELVDGIKSFRGAIKRLGPPCYESYSESISAEKDGEPPTCTRHKFLCYTKLSDVADIDITETTPRTVYCSLRAKHKPLPKAPRKRHTRESATKKKGPKSS